MLAVPMSGPEPATPRMASFQYVYVNTSEASNTSNTALSTTTIMTGLTVMVLKSMGSHPAFRAYNFIPFFRKFFLHWRWSWRGPQRWLRLRSFFLPLRVPAPILQVKHRPTLSSTTSDSDHRSCSEVPLSLRLPPFALLLARAAALALVLRYTAATFERFRKAAVAAPAEVSSPLLTPVAAAAVGSAAAVDSAAAVGSVAAVGSAAPVDSASAVDSAAAVDDSAAAVDGSAAAVEDSAAAVDDYAAAIDDSAAAVERLRCCC